MRGEQEDRCNSRIMTVKFNSCAAMICEDGRMVRVRTSSVEFFILFCRNLLYFSIVVDVGCRRMFFFPRCFFIFSAAALYRNQKDSS